MIGGHVLGAANVSRSFMLDATLAPAITKRVVRRHGQLLLTRVKGNASGRPGPNAPTGDYRRSINLEVIEHGSFISAAVGTNRVQGRRLELGFTGRDSLGRYYDQPPFPHFGPAFDATVPGMVTDIEAEIGAL